MENQKNTETDQVGVGRACYAWLLLGMVFGLYGAAYYVLGTCYELW